ncbi:MAG: glycogen-binding domain-containing protein, partial [Verrucomicrobia bacterium]|nr:glycogen-binding domain-containing protein [Verrucomicrobiota bacterium]
MTSRKLNKFTPLLVVIALMGAVAYILWVRASHLPPRQGRSPTPTAPAPVVEPRPASDTVVLGPQVRTIPGAVASPFLRYRDAKAASVSIAGTWNRWATNMPMQREGRDWVFDFRQLELDWGRYAFKFLPDGEWEPGDNR